MSVFNPFLCALFFLFSSKDGVLQSSLYGDAPYHEALVHPVMIAHPNPRRVAIIGGGEGATLREVLKHNTIDEVVMVDIDNELISLAKEYLPEWNDCSDMMGSDVKSCFDHPKARVYFSDALMWFIDRFGDADMNDIKTEDKFDVIIMDALDPNDPVDFVDELYSNSFFIESLYNGLTDKGVLVVQLGKSPSINSPADDVGSFKNRASVIETLEALGVETMHSYDEAHSNFLAPWSYLAAFKDSKFKSNWYRNAAEIDLQLDQRIHKTKSGKRPLRYFDGPTMKNYQIPPKGFATIHCRQTNVPEECNGFFGFDPSLKGGIGSLATYIEGDDGARFLLVS